MAFIEYVVGFLFDDAGENVILIEKLKPEWQRGLLNGIGGKFESTDDTITSCMIREFKEETGADTKDLNWNNYARIGGPTYLVYVMTTKDTKAFNEATTKETEKVVSIKVEDLHKHRTISNITWLVHMALEAHSNKEFGFCSVNYH